MSVETPANPDILPPESQPLVTPHAKFLEYWSREATSATEMEYVRACNENTLRIDSLIVEVTNHTADAAGIMELYKRLGAQNEMEDGAPLLLAMADQLAERARQAQSNGALATVEGVAYTPEQGLVFSLSMRLDAANAWEKSGQDGKALDEYIALYKDYEAEQDLQHSLNPEILAYQYDARVNLAIALMARHDKRGQLPIQQEFARDSQALLRRLPDTSDTAGVRTELALQAAAYNFALEQAEALLRDGKSFPARGLTARKSFKREDEPLDGRRNKLKTSGDIILQYGKKTYLLQAKTRDAHDAYVEGLEEHLGAYDTSKVEVVMYDMLEADQLLAELAEAPVPSRRVSQDFERRIKTSQSVASQMRQARLTDADHPLPPDEAAPKKRLVRRVSITDQRPSPTQVRR